MPEKETGAKKVEEGGYVDYFIKGQEYLVEEDHHEIKMLETIYHCAIEPSKIHNEIYMKMKLGNLCRENDWLLVPVDDVLPATPMMLERFLIERTTRFWTIAPFQEKEPKKLTPSHSTMQDLKNVLSTATNDAGLDEKVPFDEEKQEQAKKGKELMKKVLTLNSDGYKDRAKLMDRWMQANAKADKEEDAQMRGELLYQAADMKELVDYHRVFNDYYADVILSQLRDLQSEVLKCISPWERLQNEVTHTPVQPQLIQLPISAIGIDYDFLGWQEGAPTTKAMEIDAAQEGAEDAYKDQSSAIQERMRKVRAKMDAELKSVGKAKESGVEVQKGENANVGVKLVNGKLMLVEKRAKDKDDEEGIKVSKERQRDSVALTSLSYKEGIVHHGFLATTEDGQEKKVEGFSIGEIYQIADLADRAEVKHDLPKDREEESEKETIKQAYENRLNKLKRQLDMVNRDQVSCAGQIQALGEIKARMKQTENAVRQMLADKKDMEAVWAKGVPMNSKYKGAAAAGVFSHYAGFMQFTSGSLASETHDKSSYIEAGGYVGVRAFGAGVNAGGGGGVDDRSSTGKQDKSSQSFQSYYNFECGILDVHNQCWDAMKALMAVDGWKVEGLQKGDIQAPMHRRNPEDTPQRVFGMNARYAVKKIVVSQKLALLFSSESEAESARTSLKASATRAKAEAKASCFIVNTTTSVTHRKEEADEKNEASIDKKSNKTTISEGNLRIKFLLLEKVPLGPL